MSVVFSKRWVKLSAGFVLLLLVALTSCAWYFRIWSWHDLQVYRMMSQECHPVWRELHWGRIHQGQDVEDVIATTNPVRVERYGEFVRLNYQDYLYFTGVTITAKNGRLACATAWSCTWDRLFFNELTQEDWQAYSDAYEAHWRPIRKQRAEAERGAAAHPPRDPR
jgi:hypothetical protein